MKLNKQFSRNKIKTTENTFKTCSTYLAIKQMKIKTVFIFHLSPFKIAKFKNKL